MARPTAIARPPRSTERTMSSETGPTCAASASPRPTPRTIIARCAQPRRRSYPAGREPDREGPYDPRVPPERRPAIVAVDDEPAVLAAVARDLRRGFGERYRILRVESGDEALDLLTQLRARGDQVAMLIADQRMLGRSGTDYLVQARTIVPDAKRVLLTAYADTEAAIAAINEVALDYYLLDFLARNRVPARWLDVERDSEARELLRVAGVEDDRLPVALLADGSVLERPTILELAE